MKRTQSGFTLVELLVVIAIIGILMGLTIPAVNSARETARKSECATNMRNLALAGVQHAGAKGELPGWLQSYGTFVSGPDPSDPDATAANPPTHEKLGGWAVAILPYLDAQPTYEHWTEDRYPIIDGAGGERVSVGGGYHEFAAPNLAIMQCPSNPATIDEAGRNSYVANNGLVPFTIGTGPTATAVGFSQSMDRANGAFNNKFAGSSALFMPPVAPTGPRVRLEDFKDGQGFTMLFSENVQARGWHLSGAATAVDGFATTVGLTPTPTPYASDSRYLHGMVWHYEDPTLGGSVPSPSRQHRINGGGGSVDLDRFVLTMDPITTPVGKRPEDLARPSSAHIDGVNAAMADGATRFIRDSIDYRVYQALMTLRGKSSDVPFAEFVLTDELE
jgi:prepilin-type N-terminal cleavage/methylation domain-containing protein